MMTKQEAFNFARDFIRSKSAIVVDDTKDYLIESRLTPIAKEEGFECVVDLLNQLKKAPLVEIEEKIVEAMTTNETSFYRDIQPFEALKTQIFPELIKARSDTKRLNIWCAATSSGQEPYSISMLLADEFPEVFSSWRIKILATDISKEMLDRTREGCFSQLEVNRGLSAVKLVKHFTKLPNGRFQIKPEHRAMIDARHLNLANEFSLHLKCDLIMLRNVMIYFDIETKQSILQRAEKLMAQDAYLLLGAAETIFSLETNLQRKTVGKASCYQKEQ